MHSLNAPFSSHFTMHARPIASEAALSEQELSVMSCPGREMVAKAREAPAMTSSRSLVCGTQIADSKIKWSAIGWAGEGLAVSGLEMGERCDRWPVLPVVRSC